MPEPHQQLMLNPGQTRREAAAKYVAKFWRLQKRLPRIAQLSIKLGLKEE